MNEGQYPSVKPRLLTNDNFRWFVTAGAITLAGDQLTLVALPWLVLRLTGDPLALGVVFALQSLPRVMFMLVGGVMVDRYSPKRVLVLTTWTNAALLGLVSGLVLTGTLTPWMINAIAMASGLAMAFNFPAGNAILAQAFPVDLLHKANGGLMALNQLAVLVGPALAGLLIMHVPAHGAAGFADGRGLGVAFSLDSLSFAFAALAYARVQIVLEPASFVEEATLTIAIGTAFRRFWEDRPLFALCVYYAAINFFIEGPVRVGLPLLSLTRFSGGATSFGLLMAANGGGALLGVALSGIRPNSRFATMGSLVLLADALAALALLPLGGIRELWQGMALLAYVGILEGWIQVSVVTWVQRRIAPEMLGSMMSVIMFIAMGLSPLSATAAGTLLRVISPGALFAGSGTLLLLIALLGFLWGPIRTLEVPEPAAEIQPL
jgi:MFS family permease